MILIRVCVGSSCYLKGSSELVDMLNQKIEENGLQDKISLSGSFCMGKCNRVGVTIAVDEEVCVAITKENFNEFWNDKVMTAVNADK
ncbi:MAG: (2Fe-2S) ferredoxin domain-containing protein [Clostridia bacterium]|nr:(2Fe-2S) ferredoxin domain-containing protein [Clostridia bacterium]MDY2714750.1 (2Fe-2S) ferredoxin domain-containing protein [Christensenellaceae bacterium]MDY3724770.1 (2Fe-2S) ferredoxin domain-containing protein [Christensenellaceae bacterium]